MVKHLKFIKIHSFVFLSIYDDFIHRHYIYIYIYISLILLKKKVNIDGWAKRERWRETWQLKAWNN